MLDGALRTNRERVIEEFNDGAGCARPLVMSQEALLGGLTEADHANADRLREINPDLRLLVSLQAQRSLIPSMYHQHLKSRGYARTLDDFSREIIAGRRLDYAELYDRLCRRVDRDRVLALLFEEVTRSPSTAFHRLAAFLDVHKPYDEGRAPAPIKTRPNDHDIRARRLCNRLSVNKALGPGGNRMAHRCLSAIMRLAVPACPRLAASRLR